MLAYSISRATFLEKSDSEDEYFFRYRPMRADIFVYTSSIFESMIKLNNFYKTMLIIPNKKIFQFLLIIKKKIMQFLAR